MKETQAEQIKLSTALHLPFEQFQAVDLVFGLDFVPRRMEGNFRSQSQKGPYARHLAGPQTRDFGEFHKRATKPKIVGRCAPEPSTENLSSVDLHPIPYTTHEVSLSV